MKVVSAKEIPKYYTGIIEDDDENMVWYSNGNHHRIGGPACEYIDGEKRWYICGKLHRLDGPAIEFPNGNQSWFINGIQHKKEEFIKKKEEFIKKFQEMNTAKQKPEEKILRLKDGESVPEDYTGIIEYPNGDKAWFKNRIFHRENGPAIEYKNGSKHWYIGGSLHRKDGPAIENAYGHKEWHINGKLHRLSGPAFEWSDGKKEWYIEGKEYKEEDFNKKIQEMNMLKTKETVLKVDVGQKPPSDYTGIVEYSNGTKIWYKEGRFHREDGPAREWPNGSKEWWRNGEQHRSDGPAVEESKGTKRWMENGRYHRFGGPAIEREDGTKEWYLFGKNYFSKEEYDQKSFEIAFRIVPSGQKQIISKLIQKENSTITDNIFDSFKVDSKLVVKRTVARKIVKIISGMFVSMLSVGKIKKQQVSLRSNIEKFLSTRDGEAILGIMLGSLLPLVLNQLPQKYHSIATEMSQEFRVEGMTHFTTLLADFVTGPMFQTAKSSMIDILEEASSEKSQIRVELPNKELVEINDDIDHNPSNLKIMVIT